MHTPSLRTPNDITAPRRGEAAEGSSIVFDQAENRLHIQKAIILRLLGAE